MRTLIGITVGVTLSILVYIIKQPTLDLLFYRDKPGDPEGHKIKMRTCHGGVWAEEAWT